MFMRIGVFLFLASVVLSCSLILGSTPWSELNYPDKELQEIIIYGYYSPGDKGRVKELEKNLRDRGHLKPHEFFAEKYSHRLDRGDESLILRERKYCYNRSEFKEPILNNKLRARIYDQEGVVLTEDFLRISGPIHLLSQEVITYLPYHKGGRVVRIVRLDGSKELVLEKRFLFSKARLREISNKDRPIFRNSGIWVFNEQSECHIK